MNETEPRRARVARKIAASGERLQRASTTLPALPANPIPPQTEPPESYRALAADYPWGSVAAGLGAGMLLGALLPKRVVNKLGSRAVGLAVGAAKLGLALERGGGGKQRAAAKGGSLDLVRGALDLALKTRKR